MYELNFYKTKIIFKTDFSFTKTKNITIDKNLFLCYHIDTKTKEEKPW